tara:strand:+ start:1419 stop:1673 length:255 start_codon:yes stop_codon:yes gene_type:complete
MELYTFLAIYATILLLLCALVTFWAQQIKADIIISPMVGFVTGCLYHKEVFIEGAIEVRSYTIQILMGVISLNILWEKQNGLEE